MIHRWETEAFSIAGIYGSIIWDLSNIKPWLTFVTPASFAWLPRPKQIWWWSSLMIELKMAHTILIQRWKSLPTSGIFIHSSTLLGDALKLYTEDAMVRIYTSTYTDADECWWMLVLMATAENDDEADDEMGLLIRWGSNLLDGMHNRWWRRRRCWLMVVMKSCKSREPIWLDS